MEFFLNVYGTGIFIIHVLRFFCLNLYTLRISFASILTCLELSFELVRTLAVSNMSIIIKATNSQSSEMTVEHFVGKSERTNNVPPTFGKHSLYHNFIFKSSIPCFEDNQILFTSILCCEGVVLKVSLVDAKKTMAFKVTKTKL